jgi:hypothetical protein
MSVFQFVLAIVGALAWPAVLVFVALMLRPKKEQR